MANKDGAEILFGIGFLVVLGLVAIWAIILEIRSRKTRTHPPKSTPPWVWIVLIAVVGLLSYVMTPSRGGREAGPSSWSGLLLGLVFCGISLAFFLLVFGVLIYRQYDRVASQALKRGQAGDTEGALAELRAAIEKDNTPANWSEGANPANPYAPPLSHGKTSAIRANTMGALHALREEWPEAYEWFLQTEKIGGRQAHALGNQAVAVWKLGRPEKAVELLTEASSLDPHNVLHPCNLGLVLVELGRIEEARAQLARAEANYKKLIAFPPSSKKGIAVEVESLRKKIAADPQSRDQAVFEEA